ncbi:MAG: acyl-CoA dehydrogenase family protein [Chloroflexi bacterium]|nr:acyl-CoA dehydrogenase family protein [Chloroflexota bacterium]MBU1748825.1 acyl-CoA dehydrogenase family protein [Chloroflexota bacterium]
MDFALTEEHLMVRKMAREFAEREILPSIQENDRAQTFDTSLLPKMAEQGFLGVTIPTRYGGVGMDYIALALVCEELERADTSARVIMSVHMGLNNLTLLQWGTEEQKQKYLVPQAQGKKVAGYGLTEPGAGTDPAALKATARKEGDVYILNGEKTWISLADVADNFIVFARTGRTGTHRDISAFIIERTFPGVSSMPIHGKLGVRAGDTGSIIMEDVPVPAENLLGYEGEGFKIAMTALDNGRYTVGAGAVGLTQACIDACVKYANERETFGVPIGQHQLVQRMISLMVQRVEAGRLLIWRAGWLKNQGIRNTRETTLAKWYACDASFDSAADAVQIYGAYGYSDEYPVERFLRNSKGAVIYEGTRELQELIQAQYALGYREDRPLRCEPVPYDPDTW